MKGKRRYKWIFTFTGYEEGIIELTLEEGHKDLKYIRESRVCHLTIATLVDTELYNPFVQKDEIEGVLHSFLLPRSKLERVFSRVEQDVTNNKTRVIPAFSYSNLDTGEVSHCFAFTDRVVTTSDRNYHREEWGMALSK